MQQQHKLLCMLLLQKVLTVAEAGQTRECVSPWVSIGKIGCFLFVKDRMRWDSARSYCKKMRGDLAILDDELKRKSLVIYMERYGLKDGHSRWIGANDRSGSWLWLNEKHVTNGWRSYGDDQPDNDKRDDTCMYLYTKSYPSGKYDLLSDYYCKKKKYFICEKSVAQVPGSQIWWDLAQNELKLALNVRKNENVARNVVLFLGDGMGITATTAGRIYKGQLKGSHGEEGELAWERFPNMGLLKTYSVDKQVPDSAGTATAYLCGIKANIGTLGVGPEVLKGNCYDSRKPEYQASSILRWAQDAGKHTGIVTTTRVTHATPAAAYAHSADRFWEKDSDMDGQDCKDIADQLVNGETGKNIRVILGGGRSKLDSNRRDGRQLTKVWLRDKQEKGASAKYVTNVRELDSVDTNKTDFLLGLFNNDHMSYEGERRQKRLGEPSLKEMTLSAIKMLSKNKDGFFLLVEGGRIDHALHDNKPRRALEEIVAFDDAIGSALKELDLEETLVVVTADHSHVMTLNGFPDRGNDILGVAGVDEDDLPYTTLMFTNGPGYDYHVHNNKAKRRDPTNSDMTNANYRSQSAVDLNKETHGGEDVAVYAKGPMAHLFHHVHEQNYVAHVMAFAACVGPSLGAKCNTSNSVSNEIDNKIPALEHPSATASRHVRSLPVFSNQLQQHLNHHHQQLISTLGFEVIPRVATGTENENHVD